MLEAINRFRLHHEVEPIRYTDVLTNHHCQLHCFEMAKRQTIFHTPEYYLEGWSEAVAMMQYCDQWKDQVIFDILGVSDGHRDILLNNNKLAFAGHIHDNVVYVCIRGKNQ